MNFKDQTLLDLAEWLDGLCFAPNSAADKQRRELIAQAEKARSLSWEASHGLLSQYRKAIRTSRRIGISMAGQVAFGG